MIPLSWIRLTPKKRWLNGCSLKKCRFWRQKQFSAATMRPTVQQGQYKNVVFWYPAMMISNNLGVFPKNMNFGHKNRIFCSIKLHFFNASPMQPPYSRLIRTQFNGIITSPYYQVLWMPSVFRQTPIWLVGGLFYGPIAKNQPFLGPKNAVYSALCAVIWVTTKHTVVKIHP